MQFHYIIRDHSSVQTQIMVENITGFGMDIPMLGIREATRALRADPVALFADGVYTASNLFQISTSQARITRNLDTVERQAKQNRNALFTTLGSHRPAQVLHGLRRRRAQRIRRLLQFAAFQHHLLRRIVLHRTHDRLKARCNTACSQCELKL